MDTQGLPAPRPLLGQGGARPRCGPSLGTPIRCSSQAGVGARSCGLGATRSSPGRRRYRSRVRRVGVEAQRPWWGPGGPPRPQGLRGWRRGCGESGRGAARSAFRPGDGFLSESGRGAAPSVTVRAHGRGAFSFPFGGFGLGVFFLLCRGRGGSGGHDHGSGPWQKRPPHSPPLYRGAAGGRFLLVVGRLGGVLAAAGAGEGGFSAALWGFGGGVFILLGQGEEVAEPGRKRGRGQTLPGQVRAPGRAPPTYFILWASSQLAWTCCRACRMGVWLKTVEETEKGESGAGSTPQGRFLAPQVGAEGFVSQAGGSWHPGASQSPSGICTCPEAMGPGGGTYSSVWCWSG